MIQKGEVIKLSHHYDTTKSISIPCKVVESNENEIQLEVLQSNASIVDTKIINNNLILKLKIIKD